MTDQNQPILRERILDRINTIQGDHKRVIWISGKQLTELFSDHPPQSVRRALAQLSLNGEVRRENRRAKTKPGVVRSKKAGPGRAAWYSSVNADLFDPENRADYQPRKPQKKKAKESSAQTP